ncbi:glutamate-1-semialdehyde 2,1-aminomutase [Candidatus Margulisiibacteriota bacterium]
MNSYKYLVGGVNSPVRNMKAVGLKPFIVKKAKGEYLYDVNNKKYRDFCMSWGALILGHTHPEVGREVIHAVKNGTSFGITNPYEAKLAKIIVKAIPSIEKIRFVSSGTEAVMTAIRLARGYANRNIIIKCNECYHGHSDAMLVSRSKGIIEKNTMSIPFNNEEIFLKTIKKYKNKIAAVIVEPIPANRGVIVPKLGFLKLLRDETRKNKIVLIFDEVITGFRVGVSGAQGLYGIKPDLTTLGKIIGGGFPVGAVGGKKEIMNLLAPVGPVYQAGTLSGNPVAMAAGIVTIKECLKKDFYKKLNNKTDKLINIYFKNNKQEYKINKIGSMFSLEFKDKKEFIKYYQKVFKKGIYLSPSPFEANFISN